MFRYIWFRSLLAAGRERLAGRNDVVQARLAQSAGRDTVLWNLSSTVVLLLLWLQYSLLVFGSYSRRHALIQLLAGECYGYRTRHAPATSWSADATARE